MKIAIKFRLYPTKLQKRELFRQFAKHCELYNFCRNERIETYERTKTSPSGIDQIKANVPKFKDRTNVSSLQQTVRRVDKAFQAFFRRCKSGETPGFPRYKKLLNSIEFTAGDGTRVKVNNGKRSKLYVQFIGDIKMVAHRPLNKPTRIIIKYQNGEFYACFVTEMRAKTYEPTIKSIGLDFGLQTFVTTSDGEKIESPKFLKRSLKRLTKAISKRDKAERGSLKRRKKAKVVAKIFTKITNQRADFNHKLANRLVSENGIIAIEDLSIQKLQQLSTGTRIAHNINRTYNDVSWAQFAQMLSYKAENAGRKCIKVNPRNTSRTCNSCGKLHELTLKDRVILCECGKTEDRDINAAKNILALGLQSLLGKTS